MAKKKQDLLAAPSASAAFGLHKAISTLLVQIISAEESFKNELSLIHNAARHSALNLIHYATLRQHDIRDLQKTLSTAGLSSLGRCESHVLPSVTALKTVLDQLTGAIPLPAQVSDTNQAEQDTHQSIVSTELLEQRTESLFGDPLTERKVRIMVTLEDDPRYALQTLGPLFDAGMTVARINCAHGNREQWKKIVVAIRELNLKNKRQCLVHMELNGQKLRTGKIQRKHRHEVKVTLSVNENSAANDVEEISQKDSLLLDLGANFAMVQTGQRVIFDDGKIMAVVESRKKNVATLKITGMGKQKAKFKSQKGVNFPGLVLPFSALSSDDLENLDFAATHANTIGLSFVQNEKDVQLIMDELSSRNAHNIGLVIKIETQSAVELFPRILLTALRWPRVGVMIARGDLAVEIGFERLAEIQEEILWFCEAAHLPVVWATQVLESLAKKGLPTRAEVTDAAMSGRADCVMLNKGKHVVEAVRFLDDVLLRMQSHQSKKQSLLRGLKMTSALMPKLN